MKQITYVLTTNLYHLCFDTAPLLPERKMAVRPAPAKRGLVQAQASAGADAPIVESSSMVKFKQFSELFSNLFPVWTVISAAVALKNPAVFNFMTTESFTGWLALLMFSMGITMTLDDFKRVLGQVCLLNKAFISNKALDKAFAFLRITSERCLSHVAAFNVIPSVSFHYETTSDVSYSIAYTPVKSAYNEQYQC